MNQYSKESAETMHAALLDIMAFWSSNSYGDYTAGEMMYDRAYETLKSLEFDAGPCPYCHGKGATAPNGVQYCNCDDGDRAAANGRAANE